MRSPRPLPLIGRFTNDAQGNVALLFGLMLVPLLFAAGVGIDYARAANMRTALQSTADSAALAGASAYTNPSFSSSAQTLATNYVTNGTTPLASKITLGTTTVTPGTLTSNGVVTAYTMAVNVTATVPTTLMQLFTGAMTVHAAATAMNPIGTATANMPSWQAGQCDANTVYWYPVPADNSIPSPSSMTQMFANTGAANTGSVTIPVSATQKIGFAIMNVTGGKCPYGSNQYGGTQGSTHWLYSSQPSPNASAYGSTANQDCSLQVIQGRSGNSGGQDQQGDHQGQYDTGFAAPLKQCFTPSSSPSMSSVLQKAAPSCVDLNGGNYQYSWNDMSGSTDSLAYNGAVFTYSCTGGSGLGNGTTTSGVVLTK